MLVNPNEIYHLTKSENWEFFENLKLQETSLTFSGIGAISGDMIIQLASDNTYCYAVLFEEQENGTWQESQLVRLDESISTPCSEVNSYSQVSVAINKGVAAVLYVLQVTGVTNLAILSTFSFFFC
jgi:hypothetical protein